jgi:hypothetical protein
VRNVLWFYSSPHYLLLVPHLLLGPFLFPNSLSSTFMIFFFFALDFPYERKHAIFVFLSLTYLLKNPFSCKYTHLFFLMDE